MGIPAAVHALWAKSDPTGGPGHPLLAHLLDVAACAAAILEREPATTLDHYAADLGLPPDQARAWLGALVGLHDLGKASPAFQQKWEPGKQAVWSAGLTWRRDPTKPPRDIPHNVISQVTLPDLLIAAGWSPIAANHAADAVGAHHGFRATRDQLGKADIRAERGDAAWDAARRDLLTIVCATLGAATPPPIAELTGPAFQRLAGLTSFADWIGSSLDRAPLGDDPAAYHAAALGRARAALDRLGWFPRASLLAAGLPLPDVFAYLGSPDRPFSPRALQQLVADWLSTVAAPALLLVEAPMGEGKTEAALYAHLRLQATNAHRGLYIALPTQATGNAMFERLKTFLAHCGRERANPPDLQLLHGASELNAAYQAIIVHPNTPGGPPAPAPDLAAAADSDAAGVAAQEWFTHRKRALLSEYGVGTVDQALLAILHTKHQFVRLWGLANRVVVLDEVHAYDTYTGDLIETLVAWLHALGSSVILLSATLPAAKRAALLRAYGASGGPPATAYPRLTTVAGGVVACQPFATDRHQVIALRAAPSRIDDLAALLRDLAGGGGCIACIVNTVKRAQDLYLALRDTLAECDLLLFHARYPADQRRDIEAEVLARFGKDAAARPRRAILIATQVVEQSLDLDFDAMISDLAPVDLLLQRAGRLHRHNRAPESRHGHTVPALHVAGLQPDAEQPDLAVTGSIYEPYALLRTWLALHGRSAIALPADIDPLIQATYDDREPSGLSEPVRAALATARATMLNRDALAGAEAGHAIFGKPDEPDWLEGPRGNDRPDDADPGADDDRPQLRTRLGRQSVTVIPIHVAEDGRHWLDDAHTLPVAFTGTITQDQARRWYARSVRLSHPEIVRNIASHAQAHLPSRTGWDRVALLARCQPLVLRDNVAQIGRQRVRLDPELGIVYENADNT